MWSAPGKAAVGALVGLLLLLVAGRLAAGFAVDLLWYRSLGFDNVFWTRLAAAMAVRGVVVLAAGGVLFLNLWLIIRSLGAVRVRRRYANIEIAERLPRVYLLGAAAAVALLTGWWLSIGVGSPVAVLSAFRAPAWGIHDPYFGQDLSFYVFRYPLLVRAQTVLAALLFWTFLLVCACYAWTGAVRLSRSEVEATPAARVHVGMLVAALLLTFAWSLWLGRYELLLAGSGVGDAPGYTDIVTRVPGKAVVALLAALAAASVAYGAWYGKLRVPLVGLGTLIVGALLIQVAVPSLIQRIRVEPDELAHEARFIRQNLQFARYAYGLGGLQRRVLPYISVDTLDPAALSRTLEHIPLWDTRPLLQTYRALETRQRYYDFVSAHHDRYDGRQAVISVRELEPAGLAEISRNWQNLHLNYVRGEGAVVSPAARFSTGSQPPYFLSDICPIQVAPDAPEGLAITDPGVYFGELTREYIIVATGAVADTTTECPAGARPVGIKLDSWWKMFAFAWAFQSKNLLLSEAVGSESGIVYRRNIRERASAIAPFLYFPPTDGNAYPVIHDGHIVWVLEAYTASASFPLAPVHWMGNVPVRYIRNSVKVTIDAVTGEVRLYAMDPNDTILRAYSAIFPELLRPISEMPAELRRHLRYPAPLMSLQAEVMEEYHVEEPREFFLRERSWQLPEQIYQDESEVYSPDYVMMPLPGSPNPEFLLTLPFVAAGRQNLTALLVVRNDPPHYGEQILYELPLDEGVRGPSQVESAIDQDPEISEQLSLWKAGGSDVIRGSLLTIPLDSTLVYVEPLYLEAQASAIPQLERVILVAGDRVVMRPTRQSAIAAVTAGDADSAFADDGPGSRGAPGDTPALTDSLLARARQLIERAEAQLRAGEWARFGETWDALRDLLQTTPDQRPESSELAAPTPPL